MPTQEVFNSNSRENNRDNYSIMQAAGSFIFGQILNYVYNVLVSIDESDSEQMYISSFEPTYNISNNLLISNY